MIYGNPSLGSDFSFYKDSPHKIKKLLIYISDR